MTAGIYEIVNAINGKRYVGQATRIEKRLYEHWRRLHLGSHPNVALQQAVNKYGLLAFYWRALEIVPLAGLNADEARRRLTEAEQRHFDQTPPGKSYQLAPAAGSTIGTKRSFEVRALLSALKSTAGERARVSRQHRGKLVSEETRKRMSAANQGKTIDEEVRRKISESLKGRVFSPDHRVKILLALRSDEIRAKISAGVRRGLTAEARAKAQLGRKHSAETRAKMAESARRREQLKRERRAALAA